jgi:beta-glucanase (GH16 family)
MIDVISGINITTACHNFWGVSSADASTSNEFDGCVGEANSSETPKVVIPPISSASLRTRETFNFKYGRVEVRAQLPKGDWIFPTIGLWPTNH